MVQTLQKKFWKGVEGYYNGGGKSKKKDFYSTDCIIDYHDSMYIILFADGVYNVWSLFLCVCER